MASETTKVSKEQIEAGFKENPWGAGVAWIDKDKDGPLVRWKKGIATVEEVLDVYKTIKEGTPYVLHFRIPTEGLEDIELTHPFPISATADATFEGTTRELVLFHNGGWSDWRPYSLNTCGRFGAKLPKGMLNDSRMLAWNAYHYGESVLQLINEKVIVFGLNEDGTVHFELYGMDKQNGWNFKGDRQTAQGIWFSNDRWEKHIPKAASPPVVRNLRDIKRLTGGHGGDRPQGGFRPEGQSGDVGYRLPGREPDKDKVEGSQAPTGGGPESDGKLAHSKKLIEQMAMVHQDPDQLAWALQFNPKKYTRRTAGFIATQIVH